MRLLCLNPEEEEEEEENLWRRRRGAKLLFSSLSTQIYVPDEYVRLYLFQLCCNMFFNDKVQFGISVHVANYLTSYTH